MASIALSVRCLNALILADEDDFNETIAMILSGVS